jgi:hypothetical protein
MESRAELVRRRLLLQPGRTTGWALDISGCCGCEAITPRNQPRGAALEVAEQGQVGGGQLRRVVDGPLGDDEVVVRGLQ